MIPAQKNAGGEAAPPAKNIIPNGSRNPYDSGANPTDLAGAASLREFPRLAPESFAIRAKAIMTAKTPRELHRAIARYAFAVMWARHQTGRGFDLAREVVTGDAYRYASFSPARSRGLRIRKRHIARIVARMDEYARGEVEGGDA